MKVQTAHLPIYILIGSLFLGSFIIQFFALAVFFCFYLIGRPIVRNNVFLQLPALIYFTAVLSYVINLFTGLADVYSLLFWMVSYLPPFILMWLVLFYRAEIDFFKIYRFYKSLVYVQSFLLIYSAIQHRSFVVGDPATGTVGDANWVAFHICVVLIYEIVRAVTLSKQKLFSFRNNLGTILEVFYFFVVFIIPESTANLGFLIIVLGLLFLNEYVLTNINFKGMIVSMVCALIGFYIMTDTFVYRRIETTISGLVNQDIDKNPNFFKLYVYKKVLSGSMFGDVNFLIGTGPSTFTSRSSVVRMPEERTNDFPVELPYFKNRVFRKYISPAYAEWRRSKQSYGNFASPQTTVISVAVELGLIGLVSFASYFVYINRAFNRTAFPPERRFLQKFGKYFTLFFILSLFHLNFWEYPLMSFTYIIFAFLALRQRDVS